MLLFDRIVEKIDHPDASRIPYLAGTPPHRWPASLQAPWWWKEHPSERDRPRPTPLLCVDGKNTAVLRLLYSLLIGPVAAYEQVRTTTVASDVNPMTAKLIVPQRTNTVSHYPQSVEFDDFDPAELADTLDGLAPVSVPDLFAKMPDILNYYSAAQIYEALQLANLTSRMDIRSPTEIFKS